MSTTSHLEVGSMCLCALQACEPTPSTFAASVSVSSSFSVNFRPFVRFRRLSRGMRSVIHGRWRDDLDVQAKDLSLTV